jgi:hypothetical protein
MKKQFLFIIFFLITVSIYGQQTANQNSETQVYQKHLKENVTTLKIDVANYSSTKINDLINEARDWEGKIKSANLDSQNMILSIEHNALWQQQEINEMLTKYGITSKKIISHQ